MKKQQKVLVIGVRTRQELFAETKTLFARLDKGLSIGNHSINRLYFEDLITATRDDRFEVPWDIIDLKIPLAT